MIESIIVGIATLVIAPLVVWWTSHLLQERSRVQQDKKAEEITVERIFENGNADFIGIVDLYTEHFEDDGTNYSPEELLQFLTNPVFPDRHLPDIENIVLAGKHADGVVGFLICHYYPTRRMAMVSYFATDREKKFSSLVARQLLGRLKDLLSTDSRPCDVLFFDAQSPDPNLSEQENRKRRARPALFKLAARDLGLKAYKFQFDYICPKISLDSDTKEEPLILLCISLPGFSLPTPVPKEPLKEYLRFIYEDCYGDLYPVSDPRFAEYHEYLSELTERVGSALPDFIPAD